MRRSACRYCEQLLAFAATRFSRRTVTCPDPASAPGRPRSSPGPSRPATASSARRLVSSPATGTRPARPTASPPRPGCRSARSTSTSRTRTPSWWRSSGSTWSRAPRRSGTRPSPPPPRVRRPGRPGRARRRRLRRVHARDPALHQVLFEEAPRPPELLAELHALEDGAVAVAADVLGDALPPRRRRWRGWRRAWSSSPSSRSSTASSPPGAGRSRSTRCAAR